MIWLIGCKGMLGSEIARQLSENNFEYIGTDREVDITNYDSLLNFFNNNIKIKWIINCAAYTAVEKAEEDTELAQKLNADGPKNIATLCKEKNLQLIHISTDYVFDGSSKIPYKEEDSYKPLGVYGVTKADGEKNVLNIIPNSSYIFRTAWLYGKDGKNFVFTMINLMNTKEKITVVNDQFGTPTNAKDLASVICCLLNKRINKNEKIENGVYHFTNLGEISWYDFACKIYELGLKHNKITNNCDVKPCTTAEYNAKVTRPAYSVLSKDKVQKALGVSIPNWQDSLEDFIISI